MGRELGDFKEFQGGILSILSECLNLAGQNAPVKAFNSTILFPLISYEIRTWSFINQAPTI